MGGPATAAKNEGRTSIHQVHVVTLREGVRLAFATNGHTMHLARLPEGASLPDGAISRDAAAELAKAWAAGHAPPACPVEPSGLADRWDRVAFAEGYCARIETTAGLLRDAFALAAAGQTRDKGAAIVDVEGGGATLRVSIACEIETGATIAAAKVEGDGAASLNPFYVLDAVKGLPASAPVALYLAKGQAPCMITHGRGVAIIIGQDSRDKREGDALDVPGGRYLLLHRDSYPNAAACSAIMTRPRKAAARAPKAQSAPVAAESANQPGLCPAPLTREDSPLSADVQGARRLSAVRNLTPWAGAVHFSDGTVIGGRGATLCLVDPKRPEMVFAWAAAAAVGLKARRMCDRIQWPTRPRAATDGASMSRGLWLARFDLPAVIGIGAHVIRIESPCGAVFEPGPDWSAAICQAQAGALEIGARVWRSMMRIALVQMRRNMERMRERAAEEARQAQLAADVAAKAHLLPPFEPMATVEPVAGKRGRFRARWGVECGGVMVCPLSRLADRNFDWRTYPTPREGRGRRAPSGLALHRGLLARAAKRRRAAWPGQGARARTGPAPCPPMAGPVPRRAGHGGVTWRPVFIFSASSEGAKSDTGQPPQSPISPKSQSARKESDNESPKPPLPDVSSLTAPQACSAPLTLWGLGITATGKDSPLPRLMRSPPLCWRSTTPCEGTCWTRRSGEDAETTPPSAGNIGRK